MHLAQSQLLHLPLLSFLLLLLVLIYLLLLALAQGRLVTCVSAPVAAITAAVRQMLLMMMANAGKFVS